MAGQFSVIDCMPHCVTVSGGKICMLMPLLFAGIVLSAPLQQSGKGEEATSPSYTSKTAWGIDINGVT